MSAKRLRIAMFLLLFIAAPLVYSTVQGYWAMNLVPVIQTFSGPSHAAVTSVVVIMQFLGALFASFLLAFPVGYIFSRHPLMYGALLSMSPLVILLYLHILKTTEWSSVEYLFRLSEYLSIVFAFCVTAVFGSEVKKRRSKSET